jgi:hypothetical protein
VYIAEPVMHLISSGEDSSMHSFYRKLKSKCLKICVTFVSLTCNEHSDVIDFIFGSNMAAIAAIFNVKYDILFS